MVLTKREKEIMDAIVSIGKENVSMKEIASRLGITYNHLMKVKYLIMLKNHYATPIGLIVDYAKESALKSDDIDNTQS